MSVERDLEGSNIDYEEHEKSTLFPLKSLVMAVGILAALGLATVGSLRLLRSGSKLSFLSGNSGASNSNQASELVFDTFCSRTPYWIPFFDVNNTLYGIIPKQADNTCTNFNFGSAFISYALNPKLSKDGKFVFFYDSNKIKCFNVDARSFVLEKFIAHKDRYFAVTSEKLIKGDTKTVANQSVFSATIRRYDLNSIETDTFSYEEIETKCERNQYARVLAATSDGSKVFYACEYSLSITRRENKIIYVKDFNADPDLEDEFVRKIENMPDFVLMSPDDKYTIHFVTKTGKIEVIDVKTGKKVVNRRLGDNVDFSTIKNVAFSDDGKSIHVINVKSDTGTKQATIRSINYEKLLSGNKKFLGEALPIEFPRS